LLRVAPEMAQRKMTNQYDGTDGNFPLFVASGSHDYSQERVSIVQELLRVAPEMARERANNGDFPLIVAARKQHLGIVQELLRVAPEMAREHGHNGDFPLLSAIFSTQRQKCDSRVSIVQELLRVAPEMARERANNGDFPLIVAARNQHLGIVEELLRVAPEMARERANNGDLPLIVAVRNQHLGIVEELLRVAPEMVKERHVLRVAIGRNDPKLVRALLSEEGPTPSPHIEFLLTSISEESKWTSQRVRARASRVESHVRQHHPEVIFRRVLKDAEQRGWVMRSGASWIGLAPFLQPGDLCMQCPKETRNGRFDDADGNYYCEDCWLSLGFDSMGLFSLSRNK